MRRLISLPLLAIVACGSEPEPDLEAWHYTAVTHADGRFVAVGGAGEHHGESPEPTARIATSVDGDTWSVSFPADDGVRAAVAHGAGSWVAVGALSAAGSSVLISGDGETWRAATNPPQSGLSGIAFGNGLFVAASDFGANLYVSSDAESWTPVTIGRLWNRPEVAFVEGRFVVYGGGAIVAESTDGLDWTLTELPLSHVTQIVARGGAAYGIGFIDHWEGERPDLVRAVVVEGPGAWTMRERAGAPLISLAYAGDTVIASTTEDLVRGPDLEGGALDVVSPGSGWLAADGTTVVAGGKDGIRVSHDAGATWTVAVGPDE